MLVSKELKQKVVLCSEREHCVCHTLALSSSPGGGHFTSNYFQAEAHGTWNSLRFVFVYVLVCLDGTMCTVQVPTETRKCQIP